MHGNSIRESRTPLTRSLLPYCRTRSLLPYCRSLLSYTSTVLETALASASLGGISTTSATSSKVSYASRSRSSQFTASALNKPSSSSSSSPSYFNASALKSLPPLPCHIFLLLLFLFLLLLRKWQAQGLDVGRSSTLGIGTTSRARSLRTGSELGLVSSLWG